MATPQIVGTPSNASEPADASAKERMKHALDNNYNVDDPGAPILAGTVKIEPADVEDAVAGQAEPPTAAEALGSGEEGKTPDAKSPGGEKATPEGNKGAKAPDNEKSAADGDKGVKP